MKIRVIKAILIVVWLLVLTAFIAPDQAISLPVFKAVGGLLVIVHFAEIFLYRKLHTRLSDYVNTLLFGVLNIKLMQHRDTAQNDEN